MEKCEISGVYKCAKIILEQIDTTIEDLKYLGAKEESIEENNRRVHIIKKLSKGVCKVCANNRKT